MNKLCIETNSCRKSLSTNQGDRNRATVFLLIVMLWGLFLHSFCYSYSSMNNSLFLGVPLKLRLLVLHKDQTMKEIHFFMIVLKGVRKP